MARNHRISYCTLLVIRLTVRFTNAAMDYYQAALLTQFIEYQQAEAQARPARQPAAAGPAETDPWADPVSSFDNLPTSCSDDPKGSKGGRQDDGAAGGSSRRASTSSSTRGT